MKIWKLPKSNFPKEQSVSVCLYGALHSTFTIHSSIIIYSTMCYIVLVVVWYFVLHRTCYKIVLYLRLYIVLHSSIITHITGVNTLVKYWM